MKAASYGLPNKGPRSGNALEMGAGFQRHSVACVPQGQMDLVAETFEEAGRTQERMRGYRIIQSP